MINRNFIKLFLFALFVSVYVVAFLVMGYSRSGATPLLFGAGYLTGLAVGYAGHELGHVLAAAAALLPIRQISIGSGPLILGRRLGETAVLLHLNLWAGGFTLLYPPLKVRKIQSMLYVSGGILGNAALALLALWLLRTATLPEYLQYMLGGAALAQVIMIVLNLVARDVKIGGGTIGSDGKQLLHMLRAPIPNPTQESQFFAALLHRFSGGQAVAIPTTRVAARLCCQLRRDRWSDEVQRRDVDDALSRELRRGGLPREQELLVLDALMTDALLFRDPALCAKLDAWSTRALALGPEIETVRGIRGAALVELGRYAEAKALLEPLILAASPADRILIHAFLARAEVALGNVAAAQRLAAEAGKICDANGRPSALASLVARVEAEVGASAQAQSGRSGTHPAF